jgi:hypothetical protein
MGKALLIFEVTDEFAAAALVEFSIRKGDSGGLEGGIDVSGGGLLTYDKDLSADGRGREKK